MLYIKDLKENPDTFDLPVEFVKALPEYCPECNSPLTIDEGLHTVSCSNDNCDSYIKERMALFFILLGIRVPFREINLIQKRNQYTTPLALFNHPEKAMLYEGITYERQKEIIGQIKEYEDAELWKIVALTGRVEQGYAYKFFKDCENIEDLENRIDELYKQPQSIEEAKEILHVMQAKEDLKVYFDGTKNT